jgi:hypothetical protein
MAPGTDGGTGTRAWIGAAIPLLLAAWIPLNPGPDGASHDAPRAAAAKPIAHPPHRGFRSTPVRFIEGEDLRGYVERMASRLDDPQAMYYVSQALEECAAWAGTEDDLPPGHYANLHQWMRIASAQALAAPCRGFEGRPIDSRQILGLLQEAARQGEPHARARMLLLRDIAAPKADAISQIPELLATGDPLVVRDVGAFLAKGEVSLRYGGVSIEASTAAIAWELAACDLGYPCGPMSRIVLWQCAFKGYCDAYRYDEAIARDENPERMALAQQLRGELVYALRRQDWRWLGLSEEAFTTARAPAGSADAPEPSAIPPS